MVVISKMGDALQKDSNSRPT